MKKYIKCLAMVLVVLTAATAAGYFYRNLPQEEKEVKEKSTGKVKDWGKPEKEDLAYYGLEDFETTLPVLYINTQEKRITKENKIWATLAVLNAGKDGKARNIMEKPDEMRSITIKYRGASSYSQFDKKQYRIKFYKEQGSTNAKNEEFLGMGKNSEWVLNGPFLDKTLIRNHLVYNLAREIFEWAPDSRYVEVFVDGEYQGVYLAVEPVTNGESRLRLSKFGLLSGETPYLVKRDRVGTEDDPLPVYGKMAGKTNNDLYLSYPTESNVTENKKAWIAEDISKFEKSLYSDQFADKDTGYEKYIDVDSFVDYFVLNEVVMNNDAGNLSTYVYKELGGKMQMAVWDYNNCYDNYQWFSQDFSEFFMEDVAWYDRLLKDRDFVDKVVSRYQELRSEVLSKEHIYAMIDQYREELSGAVDRNFAVWGYTFHTGLLSNTTEDQAAGTDRNPDSYDAAIKQLKTAVEKRVAFLDEHLTDLYEGCVN